MKKVKFRITKKQLSTLKRHLKARKLGHVAGSFTQNIEFSYLLSIDSDAKTIKGKKQGYLTAIQYLAPATLSPFGNTCVSASDSCQKACLSSAGQLGMRSGVTAQISRTLFMQLFHEEYTGRLLYEINRFYKKALKQGYIPALRLNGTSDIPYESNRYNNLIKTIINEFPNIKVYDYTKHVGRCLNNYTKKLGIPEYDLTFSYSGTNLDACIKLLKQGVNVAIPFDCNKHELPKEYLNFEVIDGDLSDLRFLDKKGVWIGLSYKKPKNYEGSTVKPQETDGFIVQLPKAA